MCKSIQFFLAHLLQQGGSHGEGIEDQLVVGHNHGRARMLVQVVRLAIFDVSGLASCAASNHTCRVLWLEQQDVSSLNFYTNVFFNKQEKIFAMLALSEEHSFINTALLSGVPASLMPKLFYSAYNQVQKSNSISGVTDL